MKTCYLPQVRNATASNENSPSETTPQFESDYIDQPYDVPEPWSPLEEPDESSDLDDFDLPEEAEEWWEVFIPDDEYDLEPDPDDFDGSMNSDLWDEEPA